jgi:hypothetical protein
LFIINFYFAEQMALEWYWWVIIGVSVVAVGATAYILLKSDDEEKKSVAEEEMDYRMWDLRDKADLQELEGGLEIKVGGMEWFVATAADSETGWDWVMDPSGCNT